MRSRVLLGFRSSVLWLIWFCVSCASGATERQTAQTGGSYSKHSSELKASVANLPPWITAPDGRRLSVDEADAVLRYYDPVIQVESTLFRQPDFVIALPDRIGGVLGPDFFSVAELFLVIESLSPEHWIRDFVKTTALELEAGLIDIAPALRYWTLENPQEVRWWWPDGQKSRGSVFDYTVSLDPPQSKRWSEQEISSITPPSVSSDEMIQYLAFLKKRAELFGGNALQHGSAAAQIISFDEARSIVLRFSDRIAFKAPLFGTEGERLCDELKEKRQSGEENIDTLLRIGADPQIAAKLKNQCTDVSYQAWYAGQNAKEYYAEDLRYSAVKYVQSELFRQRTTDEALRLGAYLEALVDDSHRRLIAELKLTAASKVKESRIEVTQCTDQCQEGFFHAFSTPQKIEISAGLVRAGAAACRRTSSALITQADFFRARKEKLQNSWRRNGLFETVEERYDWRQNIEEKEGNFIGIFPFRERQGSSTINSEIFYEVDFRKHFEKCVFDNLSFVLAHEHAHGYLGSSATEKDADCAARDALLAFDIVAYQRGLAFVSELILDAVTQTAVPEFVGIASMSSEIKERFSGGLEQCESIKGD